MLIELIDGLHRGEFPENEKELKVCAHEKNEIFEFYGKLKVRFFHFVYFLMFFVNSVLPCVLLRQREL